MGRLDRSDRYHDHTKNSAVLNEGTEGPIRAQGEKVGSIIVTSLLLTEQTPLLDTQLGGLLFYHPHKKLMKNINIRPVFHFGLLLKVK